MLKKIQKDAWEEISILFCGCHEWMDLFLGKYKNIPRSNFTMTQLFYWKFIVKNQHVI